MKKSIIVGTILMACSAFAAPVLEYDFSTGKMFPAKPVLVGNPEIKDGALVLDAEKKQYLELPKDLNVSAARNCTFYTVLRFGEDGSMKNDGSGKKVEWQGTYGALFFRKNDFIVGMFRQNLYLNCAKADRKWFSPGLLVPMKNFNQWYRLACTFRNDDGITTATLYLDGRKIGSKKFADVYGDSKNTATFGRGWGGTWFFSGEVVKIMVYNEILSAKQIASMSEADAALIKRSPLER